MIAYTNYLIDARVRREAETLAAHGLSVLCLTTMNGARPSQFHTDGVEVRELAVPKYRGKSTVAYIASYLRFLLSSSVACVRLLSRRELDVVHVHNVPDILVLAGLVPRLWGCKVVLDIHDSVPETFASKFSGRPFFWKALCVEEKLSALIAHKVICVNRLQQEVLLARGIPASKTFVSMNAPDHRIFMPRQRVAQSRPTGREFNLVYHGTMVQRLGVDLIIRAVAKLDQRIPELRLHLWGHGDDLVGFQMLAKALAVGEKVLFRPGGFPLQELPDQLGSMDVGVVGNRSDVATDLMLPVKLMEYVALGIPAVVPRLRTIEHYFSNDMVAYYEPEDVTSLADAVYHLYANPEIRGRQANQAARFLRDHGWERRGAEFVNFYQRLLES